VAGIQYETQVRFGPYSYPFAVASQGFEHLCEWVARLSPDRLEIVTDRRLKGILATELASVFSSVAPVSVHSVEEGERYKRLSAVEQLAAELLEGGATRRSCVIALGGGLVGNVAGLLAALLYRGIRFIHVPTTLMAASDSTLSLKQAVNLPQGKNLLGTFYAPTFVWVELTYLDRLPRDQMRAGICESVKNAVAIAPDTLDELAGVIRPAADYTEQELVRLIQLAVDAKSRVMRRDEFERHSGIILEYGHTVGHAIETITNGQVLHGFAIGVGMLTAAEIARAQGRAAPVFVEQQRDLLSRCGAPTRFPAGVSLSKLAKVLRHDNKRGYLHENGDLVAMVILDGPATPRTTDGKPLALIPIDRVVDAAEALCHA